MNITRDTDFEGLDIAMLALMVSEDIQDQPVLIEGLQLLRDLRAEIRPYISASDDQGRREQLLHAFYHELKFSGDWNNYYAPENCLLAQNLFQQAIFRRIVIIPVTGKFQFMIKRMQ